MAYSPEHRLFLVANDVDSPPYVSLISVHAEPKADEIVGQIKFPAATGGIEQTVWDSRTDRFYINIPGVEVAVVDPNTLSVSATYPTPGCTATGLALDPKSQQLLLSCGVNPNGVEFMDTRTGQITANFPQVSGADKVWFDPGSRNFYLAASGMTSSGNPVPTATVTGSGTAWTLRETNSTGGTFTLTVGTKTTAALPFNASAGVVQTALGLIVPSTTVSGGPLPGTLSITFPAAQTTSRRTARTSRRRDTRHPSSAPSLRATRRPAPRSSGWPTSRRRPGSFRRGEPSQRTGLRPAHGARNRRIRLVTPPANGGRGNDGEGNGNSDEGNGSG